MSTQLSLRQEQCTRRTYERPRDSPHPCNIRICWLPAKCRKFAVVVGHLDVHLVVVVVVVVLDADGHRALEVTKHDGGAVLVLGLAGHVNCGGGSACARGREKMGERAADDVTTRNDSQGCHDGGGGGGGHPVTTAPAPPPGPPPPAAAPSPSLVETHLCKIFRSRPSEKVRAARPEECVQRTPRSK